MIHGARVLGVHHFAFVRESLLGLDLAEAFHRYLAWSEATTDVRHLQHRRDGLLKHIIGPPVRFVQNRPLSLDF